MPEAKYNKFKIVLKKEPTQSEKQQPIQQTAARLIEKQPTPNRERTNITWTLSFGGMEAPDAEPVLVLFRGNDGALAPNGLIYQDKLYCSRGATWHGASFTYGKTGHLNHKNDSELIIETDKGTPLEKIDRIE